MHDYAVILFNNCRGRDHASIFGANAFYDLETTGRQSAQAINLPVGQECAVASYADGGRIRFDWHALDRELTSADDTGKQCRVFFGPALFSESMAKSRAVLSKRYQAFFNVKGAFKQSSVILAAVPMRYRPHGSSKVETLFPDEIDRSKGPFVEGATCQVVVNAIERSAAARAQCIEVHGVSCCICGFNFAAEYGAEASGFIHVHHLKPLSEIKSAHVVDPKHDMRPVCPNCHAVLHLRGTIRSVDEVKSMIVVQRKGANRASHE